MTHRSTRPSAASVAAPLHFRGFPVAVRPGSFCHAPPAFERGRPHRAAPAEDHFSRTVVLGLLFPCLAVTKRPLIALRYAPPVLPLLPAASRTVVLRLAFPCFAGDVATTPGATVTTSCHDLAPSRASGGRTDSPAIALVAREGVGTCHPRSEPINARRVLREGIGC